MAETISLLIICLFIYAGAIKLFEYEKFKTQLGQSPLLMSMTGLVAWTIPLVEVLISILIATKSIAWLGFYAAFSLMFLFTLYIIIIMLNFAKRVPCSCGGVLENMGWAEHLVFNIGYVLLSVIQRGDLSMGFCTQCSSGGPYRGKPWLCNLASRARQG